MTAFLNTGLSCVDVCPRQGVRRVGAARFVGWLPRRSRRLSRVWRRGNKPPELPPG